MGNDIPTTSPLLSIVVVNSDGMEDTINCLESIHRHPPGIDFEILVVDNCSEQPAIPKLNKVYPQLRTFLSPEHQGFSKNYNLGIRQSQGEYLLIINNDTIVHANALDHLITSLIENPSYGMVGPKLLLPDGYIQTVCARELLTPSTFILRQLFLDLGTPTGRLWDRFLQKRLVHRPSGPVPCISGACMLTSSKVLEQVGLLDETYDFYFEDVEWCHRIQKQGFEVAYIAEAEITHLGDQSISKVREWAKKSEYLGALHYFKQYYKLNKVKIWSLWLATVLSYLLRAIYFSVDRAFTKKKNLAKTYWRLIHWILQQAPLGKPDFPKAISINHPENH
jgi:GT2 family glycosyltransferase